MREPDPAAGRGRSVTANILAVLRCFSVDEPLLGVTELAARLDLHKSSVSRILSALEDEEVVEQDPHSKKYRLGLGLLAIAGPMLATLDIRRFALPVLTELSESTGETAALTVWSAAEAVVVEQVASTQLIKHTVPLGTRYTNLDSASVQVFAAEAEVSGQHTEPGLAERLEEVRTRGYAVNHAATSPDVVGIAAGVRDHRGELVAAIIIAAPLYRVPDDRIGELGDACAAAAADLSMRLGHRS